MAVTHHKSSATIRGVKYNYGDPFVCYASYGGATTSEGSGSAADLTKGTTYYYMGYATGDTDNITHPYAVSITSGGGIRGWYKENVFPYATYTIKYNANGGSGAPSSQTKTHGTNLTLSSTIPKRTGYTFVAWALTQADANNGTWYYKAGSTCGKNENLTLYAVWEENCLTINYYSNYATSAFADALNTVGSNRAGSIYESDFADRTIDGVLTLTPDNCSHLGKSIIAYFTFSTGIINDKTIITVNEEITTNTSNGDDSGNNGGSSSGVSSEETPEVVIPSTLYGVVGHEFVLYYDNILKCMIPEDFVVSTVFANSSNSILNLKPQFDRMLKFTPTADHIGTHAITIKVMSRRTWETVAIKESSIIISADTERIGRKVMFIGDSLTYASTYPAEIERMTNGGITSVGTISHTISFNDGSVKILSEGRNSMASYDYVGRETAHSYSNPFYNPNKEYSLTLDAKYTSATGYLTFDNSGSVSVLKHHFDFEYYMTNNADTVGNVDAVFINLGTNGGNGYALSDVFVAFDAMIERIRAYSETLPIFLHLFPPTSRAGNASRNSNGIRNTRIELDCRKGYYDCIQTLIDRYENDSRVTIVPTYTMLDTIYDYKLETVEVSARNTEKVTIGQTDSTHPAKPGYLHMADSYYNVLQYKLDNNDEPEVPEEPEEPVSGYTNINSGEAGTVHVSGAASLDKVVYQVGGYPSTSSTTGLNSDSKVATFGMIPAVDGDTIYIKGINIYVGNSPTTQGTHARFAFYKSKADDQNRTIIKAEHKFYNSSSTYVTLTCLDATTNYYSIKINNTGLDYDYVGFSLETDAAGAAALIITKNEPIV